MNKSSTPEEQACNAVREAEAQAEGIQSPLFTPPAFATLKASIRRYIVELIGESAKVAKRHRADSVSCAHVERASEYLVSSNIRRILRHLGTVGDILLGAALSNLLGMSLAGQYTGAGSILATAFGIVGAFMIALHIARD